MESVPDRVERGRKGRNQVPISAERIRVVLMSVEQCLWHHLPPCVAGHESSADTDGEVSEQLWATRSENKLAPIKPPKRDVVQCSIWLPSQAIKCKILGTHMAFQRSLDDGNGHEEYGCGESKLEFDPRPVLLLSIASHSLHSLAKYMSSGLCIAHTSLFIVVIDVHYSEQGPTPAGTHPNSASSALQAVEAP